MLQKARKYDRGRLQNRILVFALIMWGAILLLVGRYGWLQVVRGDDYAKMALYLASGDGVGQSPRGKILDRNGRELAISRMAKSVYVVPNEVKDADDVANKLAPVVGVPVETIKEKIADGGYFAWIKRQMEVDEERAVRQVIKDNKFEECVGLQSEVKRYYPNDMLAANVIGFVGIDDNGLDGIERQLDNLIKGNDPYEEEEAKPEDRSLQDILVNMFTRRKYTGDRCKDVTLTLDSGIQFIVEQALEKAASETNPKAVTAIVMDPRNGDVLAMATRPSYNPNKYGDYPPELWRNRAVSFIYEPGSTFKAMVAGMGLQEKVVAPNQWFVDPGYIMVSEKRIQNWNGESFGTITFTDVVKNSINTGFAQLGLEIGGEKLTKYAIDFGFGDYTNIELPGEECGILFDPKDMVDSDIATMAIGQSIAVTPLQLITAMSSIANDGVLLKPHIVKKITNADGSAYKENGREEVRRVIESATDKTLVGMLEQVVATGGGSKAAVKGYRIAGKTGTAQKIREDGAGYMDGRYIASFCGFAPVENPQITVLVIIDDPQGQFYGGQIAAPVAGEIFNQLFRYLHIEPTSDPFVELDKAIQKKAATRTVQETREIPVVPEGKVLVPDLRGKSIREASQKLTDLGININVQGSGMATSQDIPPYTVVDPGITITVNFDSY